MIAAVRPGAPPVAVNMPFPVIELVRRATMFAAAIAALLVGEGWIARWIVPLARVGCPGCGYSMEGAGSARCPECGLLWGRAAADGAEETAGAAGSSRV